MNLRMAQLQGILASSNPYRGVQDSLSKLLGISWSHEAIRQNVIREGKRIPACRQAGKSGNPGNTKKLKSWITKYRKIYPK